MSSTRVSTRVSTHTSSHRRATQLQSSGVPRAPLGAATNATVNLGVLGAMLLAARKANLSAATTSPASASGTLPPPPSTPPTPQPSTTPTPTGTATVIPFPRAQASSAITAILRPLSTPDEVLQVLAGAGERGYIQPFLNRLVGRVPAGQTITGSLPVPDGFVIFAVGSVSIRVFPRSVNAYVIGFSEDNTPPSIAPLPFTEGVEFPAAFLLPASIDVSFTIVGDPDLDLIYSGTAAAIGAPLDYAEFITNYLRAQVRAVDQLERAAVAAGGASVDGGGV
jgi:hypothetical protein